MNCEHCGREFSKENPIMVKTVSYMERRTPIIGIQRMVGKEALWELNYEKEQEREGDFIEWGYECAFCEHPIHDPKHVLEVIKSYEGE